jgi:hypothetical protein
MSSCQLVKQMIVLLGLLDIVFGDICGSQVRRVR